MRIQAPDAASARAVASPRPDAPPVTSADGPRSRHAARVRAGWLAVGSLPVAHVASQSAGEVAAARALTPGPLTNSLMQDGHVVLIGQMTPLRPWGFGLGSVVLRVFSRA